MRLLLDTHTLLWFARGDEALRLDARMAIANPDNEVLVSVVSMWEVAIKVRIGKLEVSVPDLAKNCVHAGFKVLNLTMPHVERLASLRFEERHRDPFDHLLLAQSAAEDATFVTDDRHAGLYGVPIMKAR